MTGIEHSSLAAHPVAYEKLAALPSCERTLFTRRLTMPGVTRAMVAAHRASEELAIAAMLARDSRASNRQTYL